MSNILTSVIQVTSVRSSTFAKARRAIPIIPRERVFCALSLFFIFQLVIKIFHARPSALFIDAGGDGSLLNSSFFYFQTLLNIRSDAVPD